MIFVQSTESVLFIMLSDKDVKSMREKHTIFVDQRQLQGHTFNKVVLSLEKTDQESLKLIRAAGHRVDVLSCAEPGPKESVCYGCFGLIETATMLDGKCIACWRQEVKDLLLGRN